MHRVRTVHSEGGAFCQGFFNLHIQSNRESSRLAEHAIVLQEELRKGYERIFMRINFFSSDSVHTLQAA